MQNSVAKICGSFRRVALSFELPSRPSGMRKFLEVPFRGPLKIPFCALARSFETNSFVSKALQYNKVFFGFTSSLSSKIASQEDKSKFLEVPFSCFELPYLYAISPAIQSSWLFFRVCAPASLVLLFTNSIPCSRLKNTAGRFLPCPLVRVLR